MNELKTSTNPITRELRILESAISSKTKEMLNQGWSNEFYPHEQICIFYLPSTIDINSEYTFVLISITLIKLFFRFILEKLKNARKKCRKKLTD